MSYFGIMTYIFNFAAIFVFFLFYINRKLHHSSYFLIYTDKISLIIIDKILQHWQASIYVIYWADLQGFHWQN